MDEYLVADFADVMERANASGQTTFDYFADEMERVNAYGQTIVDFIGTEQYLNPPVKQTLKDIVFAQNNEDSNAMGQLDASVSQAAVLTGTSQSKVERKRASDKAYRERKKKHNIEMEDNMKALAQENKILKDENGALKCENTHMNRVLKSQMKEIDQLQRDHDRLKLEYKKQNTLVQILSEKLAVSESSDLREENQTLQNEIDLLRQSMGMDNPISRLVEETLNLKQQIRVKDVQLGALCEKLIIAGSLSS